MYCTVYNVELNFLFFFSTDRINISVRRKVAQALPEKTLRASLSYSAELRFQYFLKEINGKSFSITGTAGTILKW